MTAPTSIVARVPDRHWSAGRDKWGDPTGHAHLQRVRAGFAYNACGAKTMTFGMSYATPAETGAHACARCLAIERNLAAQVPSS